MKKHILFVAFISFIALALSSCIGEPDFSNIPAITFHSIRKITTIDAFSQSKKDSVILTIDFQDGNGDLGMTQDEFSGTKVTSPSLKGINNYEVKVFRAKNGTFSEVQFSPSLSGFIPFYFKPDGKSGPIEGTVDYSIAFLHAFTPKKDTLKFEVRIRDRALNYSNSVQSSQIVLNSD